MSNPLPVPSEPNKPVPAESLLPAQYYPDAISQAKLRKTVAEHLQPIIDSRPLVGIYSAEEARTLVGKVFSAGQRIDSPVGAAAAYNGLLAECDAYLRVHYLGEVPDDDQLELDGKNKKEHTHVLQAAYSVPVKKGEGAHYVPRDGLTKAQVEAIAKRFRGTSAHYAAKADALEGWWNLEHPDDAFEVPLKRE